MTYLRTTIVGVLAACLPVGVFAAPDVLLEQNGWTLLRNTHEQNGVTWCSLQTWNEDGLKFAFNGSDTRDATLLFRADEFDFERQLQPMHVDIDGRVWAFDMVLDGVSMMANLRDNPESDDLLDAISNGRRLSVTHANGGPDMGFDLQHVDEPLRAMMACWSDIIER